MAAPESRQKHVTRNKRGQFAKGVPVIPEVDQKQLLNSVFFWRKGRSFQRSPLNFTSGKG